jgi:hypothetical protein
MELTTDTALVVQIKLPFRRGCTYCGARLAIMSSIPLQDAARFQYVAYGRRFVEFAH